VNVIVIKSVVDVGEDFLNHLHGQVESGVKLPHILPIAVQRYVLVFLTPTPRLSMGRCVNLWNHSDASQLSILDNCSDIRLTKSSSKIAVLTEFRDIGDIHREAILIHDMPVQNIEFGIEHCINDPLDGINIRVMS